MSEEFLNLNFDNLDLDEYRRVIEYCESRSTGTEGIPAIIGLDDLTDPDRPVYEGAPMDNAMKDDIAMHAMVFTYLYEQMPDRDPHYPAIAPAMSAAAEKCFLRDEKTGEAVPYRTLWQEK